MMFRFSKIRIIGFLVLQLEIMREVNSLKCHVNEKGKEPEEKECQAPKNEFCGHIASGGEIERKCMPKGLPIGCTKIMGSTTCICEADNCNHECTAGTNCEPLKPVARQMANATDSGIAEKCDAKCNAPGGGSGGDDAAATEGGANAAPTGDVPGATEGGAGAAATGDGAGATGGGSAATSGNQRVVESNQFVFLIWILVILSINSL